jgi:hypothetical protein
MTERPTPPHDLPPDELRQDTEGPTDEERTFGQKLRSALREACDDLLRNWWIAALIVLVIVATWAAYRFFSTHGPGDVWRRIPEQVGQPP